MLAISNVNKYEVQLVANQESKAKSVAASSAATSDFLCDCRASRTTATRVGFSVGNTFSTLQMAH